MSNQYDSQPVLDAFALRQEVFTPYANQPPHLFLENHQGGPRLMYRRNGYDVIMASWVDSDVWVCRLPQVDNARKYEGLYPLIGLLETLKSRLSRFKVDYGFFGSEITETALAEKLMTKVMKGI